MTTPIEDRLRDTLLARADQVRPSPPPVGLAGRAAAAAHRRRLLAAAVAVTVAVVVAIGAIGLLRNPGPEYIEPIVRPPKVFKLTEAETSRPGRSLVAVLPTDPSSAGGTGRRTMQLRPAASNPVRALATTDWLGDAYSQHLSWDGTRVIRQSDEAADPRLEIVNLEAGTSSRVGGRRGYCPTLSPDNRIIAMVSFDGHLTLVDSRNGQIIWQGFSIADTCAGMGWSPDGNLLTVPGPDSKTNFVLNARGHIVARLGAVQAVNANMSWSPDGRSLLAYDRVAGGFLIKDVLNDTETAILATPPDALRPLGWAGARVVWLTGKPGDYRLVSTDLSGADQQPWMRIDAGDRTIQTVQWSWDISGRPATNH